MPEQFKTCRSQYQGEKEVHKEIQKLARRMTDCVTHKIKGITTEDEEYWGMREVITDQMAHIANKMKIRKFYTIEELIKMNKDIEPAELQKLIDQMSVIGILEYDYSDCYDDNGPTNAPRTKRWRVPYYVPGAAELFNSSKERIDKNPAVANAFERMTFHPLAGITEMVPPGGDGIGMHVIPVEEAVKFENKAVKLEKISYWLQKYTGHLAAGICSCRYSRAKLGEGCVDDINDWCIQVGDMADYAVETHRAHYITKEQALDILKKAEDNGFVHQITNIDGETKIFDICNCDVKICNALRTSMLFNTPNLSRSAFTAKVDPNHCAACGLCVESCPAGAVKLGQTFCHKDGSEVTYPQAVLPDNIKWGKYAWDENYRDTARLSDTYLTGSAPCKAACPAHVPVQAYLRKAKEGKYQEAIELIKTANPFPAVCGRVCNKKCEEACTRGSVDQAVSIDAVKKFCADYDLNSEHPFVPAKAVPSMEGYLPEKIAIIGAGPAGLSCAFYLAKMGFKPTVFEKHELPGGMMEYGIPSYKLDKGVLAKEIDVIRQLGAEIKCGVEVGKDVTIDQLKEQGYKAFFIAIGCQGGRRPNVPGDTAKETDIAVHYLQDAMSKGQPEYIGRVLVVGGGNVAVDCARNAALRHSSHVTMVSLETRETMPASAQEIKETLADGVEVVNGWGPQEVLLTEDGHVKGVRFKKCLSTIDPETHKFSPKYDEAKTMEVACDYVVFAIGQAIEWGDLLKNHPISFWHGNYPIADKLTYQTSDPDIFVGGDVLTGPKFVINAVAAGHFAADFLARHVREHASLTIGAERHHFIPLDKDDIKIDDSYDHAGRQEAEDRFDKAEPFKEHVPTLTAEQVKTETSRCLSCGRAVVDPHKCIGCGICTTRCHFDAIHLFRDHPEMTDMRKAEDKISGLAGYAIKREFKIIAHSGSKEAKMMRAKRKAYNKATKEFHKTHPETGNAITEEEYFGKTAAK